AQTGEGAAGGGSTVTLVVGTRLAAGGAARIGLLVVPHRDGARYFCAPARCGTTSRPILAAPPAASRVPTTSVTVEPPPAAPSPVCAPPLGTAVTCAPGVRDGAAGLGTAVGAADRVAVGVAGTADGLALPSANATAPGSASAPTAATETRASRGARRADRVDDIGFLRLLVTCDPVATG
ncbi:hypothetical protein ACFPZF_29400, partial [Kitasatospora cinereorecta]